MYCSLSILLAAFSVSALNALGSEEFGNKVNLALRQTGDALLLHQGDSASVIPPVQRAGENEFIVQMNSGFDYTYLPEFLAAAFEDYGINQPYKVMVRSCETGLLVLGYNKAALERDTVACRDRGDDLSCASIHVVFDPQESSEEKNLAGLAWLLIPVAGVGGVLLFRKKGVHRQEGSVDEIVMGNYRFNPKNQKLSLADQEYELTFRESKLLHYFSIHADEVLNRDEIMAAVWEDEGIVVGRSLDVFISRLRKILKADDSVSIKTVHGVGYRMEVRN